VDEDCDPAPDQRNETPETWVGTLAPHVQNQSGSLLSPGVWHPAGATGREHQVTLQWDNGSETHRIRSRDIPVLRLSDLEGVRVAREAAPPNFEDDGSSQSFDSIRKADMARSKQGLSDVLELRDVQPIG
jgi:hypothetical protein